MCEKAYWQQLDNVGDKLTPWFYHACTKKNITWIPPQSKKQHYIAVGSIVAHANEYSLVWGAGILWKNQKINPKAKFLAVRGPITRQRIIELGGECPEIYGDPALLSPLFYIPKPEKKQNFGLIPHCIDYKQALQLFGNVKNLKIIDIRRPVENVINEIASCNKIISTSLHGLILSDAYQIPCKWGILSNKLSGDNIKFRDYWDSIKTPHYRPVDLSNINKNILHYYDFDSHNFNWLPYQLLKTCPFYTPFYNYNYKEQDAFKITSAKYGSNDKFVDVKNVIKDKIIKNTLSVMACNQLAGDPCYGVKKKLVVEYELKGKTFIVEAPENKMLFINL